MLSSRGTCMSERFDEVLSCLCKMSRDTVTSDCIVILSSSEAIAPVCIQPIQIIPHSGLGRVALKETE